MRGLDAKQLADLRACVDDKLVVVQNPRRCPVSLSWRALEIAHKPIASTAALQCSGPFPVWVKFGNPASAEVRVSREAARNLIQLDVAIRLVQSAGPRVVAAADAFAEGDRAGIGGWWIRPDVRLCPENINWFSYQIYRDDLPEWFRAEDLASVIGALEALAQFVLCLLLIEEVEPESRPACLGRMILRQQCDNHKIGGRFCTGRFHDPATVRCAASHRQIVPGAGRLAPHLARAWRAEFLG